MTPTKKWKLKHPERARESHRVAQAKWRAKNRARVAATQRAWNAKNRAKVNEYHRRHHFKSKYGITIEERNAMLVAQGGCCAVCRSPNPGSKNGWVVDHCHVTEKVRAILCHHCNFALGNVKDKTRTLRGLMRYLESHHG